MAGILNTKTRIFDTIITNEGKRQLATGDLQIRFVSFTDGDTFYQADLLSGSADASRRIYTEAAPRRQDQITFETDDKGNLIQFDGSDLIFRDGKIISASVIIPPGSQFASLSRQLLTSSIQNFQDLMLIGSDDVFRESVGFNARPLTSSFQITDKRPFKIGSEITKISIDDVESFFQDRRLSHIDNFQHLPPVLVGTTQSLGRFPSVRERDIQTYEQLQEALTGREHSRVVFYDTSRSSNLVSQIFESSTGQLTKLDIIDFGEFVTNDSARPIKQVYFAGKVYLDRNGTATFVNLFTLTFD